MYILHLGTSAKNGVDLRLPGQFIFAVFFDSWGYWHDGRADNYSIKSNHNHIVFADYHAYILYQDLSSQGCALEMISLP